MQSGKQLKVRYWITIISMCLVCLQSNIGIKAVEQVSADTVKQLPIYSVDTKEKQVALTFDVAWGEEDLDEILEILNEYNAKASFFIVGDWAKKYPEYVKLIAGKGHDLGNHSSKHPHVTQLTKEQVKKDIMDAHRIIYQLTGEKMTLYRAPYGEYNNTVLEAAKECGYHTIQWDVDSLDWKNYGRQALIDKVLLHKQLTYGSIILLHNGTKYTKDALKDVIEGLISKGYKLVPVSELLIQGEYTVDHTGRQYKAK